MNVLRFFFAFQILGTVCALLKGQGVSPTLISNESILVDIGPNEPFVVGLTITSTVPGAKIEMLIRAAGPSLAQLDVADPHPDPKLEIYAPNGDLMNWNDEWERDVSGSGKSDVGSAISRSGAFSFIKGSADAAIHTFLESGMQTIHIKPAKNSGSGVVQFEIYALSNSTDAEISNLSFLTRVGPDRIIRAGLTLKAIRSQGEHEEKRALIRAVGPALAQFGISNPIFNPKISIYNRNGFVTSYERWENFPISPPTLRQEYLAAQSACGAFPLQVGSRDAATLFGLTPVTPWYFDIGPADGVSSGIVLFEIYNVPKR